MIDYTDDVHKFLIKGTLKLSELLEFPGVNRISFLNIIVNEHLFMCFKDQEPVGFLYATARSSIFTNDVKVLTQHALYANAGTKAAYLLLKHFLDFGKLNADHVITMINPHTNIKPSSLEKMGFKELETLYRWKNG